MKRLSVILLAFGLAGCATLPFEAGRTKEEKPYPEGEWVGPVSVDTAEKEVLAASEGRQNRMGWLHYDVRAEWKKLRTLSQPGDEIWQFRMSQFVVDGGDRYFGFSLIRGKKIVASVITSVIEEHAP
jgi:hypothetical protein